MNIKAHARKSIPTESQLFAKQQDYKIKIYTHQELFGVVLTSMRLNQAKRERVI